MADVVDAGTVKVTLTADGAQSDRELRRVAASWSNLGTNMQIIGRDLAYTVAIPMAALGAAAVKTASDFDYALAKIRGLVGKSREEVDQLGVSAREMGIKFGQGAQAAANSLYYMTSGPLRENKLALEGLEAASKGAMVGLGNMSDLAKVASFAVQAWGNEGMTAAKAMDILTAAVREGMAEPAEFAASLGKIIPVSAQMGISLADTAAAIAGLSLPGESAYRATTSLRQAFLDIQNPAKKSQQTLAEYGLSADQMRDRLRQGVLPALQFLTKTLSDNEEALGNVFVDIRALNGVLGLTTGNQEKMARVFQEVNNSVGDLDAAVKEFDSELKVSFMQSMARVQDALITIGRAIGPAAAWAFEMITKAAKGLADALNILPGPLKALVVGIGVAAAAVALWTKYIGMWFSIAGSMKKISNEMSFLSKVYATNNVQAAASVATETVAVQANTVAKIANAAATRASAAAASGNMAFVWQESTAMERSVAHLAALRAARAASTAQVVAAVQPVTALAAANTTLTGAIASVAGSSWVVSGALTGGLVVAAGAAGYGIGTLLSKMLDLDRASNLISDKMYGINTATGQTSEAFRAQAEIIRQHAAEIGVDGIAWARLAEQTSISEKALLRYQTALRALAQEKIKKRVADEAAVEAAKNEAVALDTLGLAAGRTAAWMKQLEDMQKSLFTREDVIARMQEVADLFDTLTARGYGQDQVIQLLKKDLTPLIAAAKEYGVTFTGSIATIADDLDEIVKSTKGVKAANDEVKGTLGEMVTAYRSLEASCRLNLETTEEFAKKYGEAAATARLETMGVAKTQDEVLKQLDLAVGAYDAMRLAGVGQADAINQIKDATVPIIEQAAELGANWGQMSIPVRQLIQNIAGVSPEVKQASDQIASYAGESLSMWSGRMVEITKGTAEGVAAGVGNAMAAGQETMLVGAAEAYSKWADQIEARKIRMSIDEPYLRSRVEQIVNDVFQNVGGPPSSGGEGMGP